MKVSIDSLRSAVKSVLPLAAESYRKSGTGVFCVLQNSLYLVSGSFNSRLGGARVTDDLEGTDEIVDKYFSISDLYQFLTATFSSEMVDINLDGNKLVFKIGRNKRSFLYESVANIAGFIKIPPLSSSMNIQNIGLLSAVAQAAQDDGGTNINLSGVFFKLDNEVELIATDGFIMAYYKIHNDLPIKGEFLVPGNFLLYVGRIYWDESPRLHLSENKVWVFNDNFFACSPTIGDVSRYPGQVLIEHYANHEYDEAAKVETTGILDKLNVLGGVDKRDVNVSAVVFTFDDEAGELEMNARSRQENGEAVFYIPANGLTDKWIINVHAVKKIGGVIRNMMGSPYILFSRHDNGEWMIVRPYNNDNIVFGIVPMSH